MDWGAITKVMKTMILKATLHKLKKYEFFLFEFFSFFAQPIELKFLPLP